MQHWPTQNLNQTQIENKIFYINEMKKWEFFTYGVIKIICKYEHDVIVVLACNCISLFIHTNMNNPILLHLHDDEVSASLIKDWLATDQTFK